MDIKQLFLPLTAISGCLFIAFLAIFTEHRQRMLMIKKGIHPDLKNDFTPSGLKSGLIFTFGALVVLMSTKDLGKISGYLPWYGPGGILLALGLANLTYYFLQGRYASKYRLFKSAIINNQQRIGK